MAETNSPTGNLELNGYAFPNANHTFDPECFRVRSNSRTNAAPWVAMIWFGSRSARWAKPYSDQARAIVVMLWDLRGHQLSQG